MTIKGKVHCFFEQSGTFKRAFMEFGIPAEDYDIQNNFGETDHVIDLFAEIENGYALMPEGPGLGVDLKPDIENLFPFERRKILTRLHEDGSIVDQ